MLRRLWLVTSIGWAMVFVVNGISKEAGPGLGDLAIAAAPFVAGLLFWRVGAYVVRG